MTDTLQLVLEATIRPGQEGELKIVADRMVPLVQNEEGTIDFRWVREPDTPNIRFFDLYTDSDAFVEHFTNARNNGTLDALMACIDFTKVTVIGDPGPAAKAILDRFGARYYRQYAGFSRIRPLQESTLGH